MIADGDILKESMMLKMLIDQHMPIHASLDERKKHGRDLLG
jgi:hypothetical protein